MYCGQEVGVSSPSIYNGTNTINWTANSDMLLAYTNLLNFYNSSATARTGTLTTYNNDNVVVFTKTSATQQVVVLDNTRSTSQTLTVPVALQGNWTNALTGEVVTLSGSISLTGFQYFVLIK